MPSATGVPERRVAVTSCPLTAACVEAARAALQTGGHDVTVFEADGKGGRTMEAWVQSVAVRGVLDIATTELAGQLVGGACGAGPDRLTAAALCGLPQVVSLGGLDAVRLATPDEVPQKLRGRRCHSPDGVLTYVRTTPEENDALGREIAHKASASSGRVLVLVPLQGLSALDAAGQAFWWPDANAALLQSLRNWMSPHVRLVELDLHINDPAFGEAMAQALLQLMACEDQG